MQVLKELLKSGARPFRDYLNGAAVRKVAHVAGQSQEARPCVDKAAEVDTLNAPTDHRTHRDGVAFDQLRP